MKMTLRKATKIRNRLEAKFQEVSRLVIDETNKSINVYDPTSESEEQLRLSNQTVMTNVESLVQLARAQEELRSIIADANGVTINRLLAEQNALTRLLNLYTTLSMRPPMPSVTQLAARIEGLRASASTSASRAMYGGEGNSTFAVSTLSPSNIELFKERRVATAKRIDELQDAIEAHNATITVEIPEWLRDTLIKFDV